MTYFCQELVQGELVKFFVSPSHDRESNYGIPCPILVLPASLTPNPYLSLVLLYFAVFVGRVFYNCTWSRKNGLEWKYAKIASFYFTFIYANQYFCLRSAWITTVFLFVLQFILNEHDAPIHAVATHPKEYVLLDLWYI